MYHITASFKVPADQHEEFVDATLADARESLANESGTLRFELIKDLHDERVFYLNEAYADEAAFAAHCSGPYYEKFQEMTRRLGLKATDLIKGTRIVDRVHAPQPAQP